MQSGVFALYLAMYFKIYCTLLFPLLTKNIVFWNQVILFSAFIDCMHVFFIFFLFLFLHYRASLEESAYGRIKQVLRWYLSGFYKKPKVSYVHSSQAYIVLLSH